jgi:hypothetical protein
VIYRVLVEVTIIVHVIWILFLIFGFILALKRSKLAFLHLAGLLFTLFLNIMEWYCPLTYLENYLRASLGSSTNADGSFMVRYAYSLIYPDLPETYIRIGDTLFLCMYLTGYACLARKYHILDRIKGG